MDHHGAGEKEPPFKKLRLHNKCDQHYDVKEDITLTLEPSPFSKKSEGSVMEHVESHAQSSVPEGGLPIDESAQVKSSTAVEEIPQSSAEMSVLQQQTREEDVGITEYISTHPGIFGVLKQRL